MKTGTPKTLEEAIANGSTGYLGSVFTVTGRSIAAHIQPHVRDFLAQKFSVAILNAKDDATLKVLADLFSAITGEKNDCPLCRSQHE
jgi:hypothetical protein